MQFLQFEPKVQQKFIRLPMFRLQCCRCPEEDYNNTVVKTSATEELLLNFGLKLRYELTKLHVNGIEAVIVHVCDDRQLVSKAVQQQGMMPVTLL